MTKHTLACAYILSLAFGLMLNAVAQQKETNGLTSDFDNMLSQEFKSDEPGATALIAHNGQIIYERAFGMANLELQVPMHVDNVFRIGSITKQFTAVAILQLMEEGRLDLQDEITKYIPDYPTQGQKITIENLLTHTSGIQDYARMKDTKQRGNLDFTPREMIDYFKNQPMRFIPGSKWEYSNSGYFLLGYIIEAITGKTYSKYLEDNIFKPLGMKNTSYASDRRLTKNRANGYSKGDDGFENAAYLSMTQPYAAGGIQSTAEDIFLWNKALLSSKLITKESLNRAWTPHLLTDGMKTHYGYGWRFGYIQDSPSIWHGGLINGFMAVALYLPKEDVFVAVFSNCDCKSTEDMTAKLAALAIGKPYDYKPIPVADSLLPWYTGVYENEEGDQRIITLSGNQLYSQRGRGPKAPIEAYYEDRFFFDDNPLVTIEFARDEQGEVDKLITRSRDGNDVWIRTHKAIPSPDGMKLDERILDQYSGKYEIAPEFSFVVTKEHGRLFIQGTGQEPIEIVAKSETNFFTKVNDAQLTFVKDDSGTVTKAVVRQNGRTTDAKKIR